MIETPEHASVMIFDREGSDILAEFILRGLQHVVMPVRGEVFYLSPKILVKMAKHFDYGQLLSGRTLRSLGFQAYLKAFVECVGPKVVITYIDNDISFQWLSREYPGIKFIAVQNGVRNKYDLKDTKKMTMPDFVCFGQNDVDNYDMYGHTIEKAHCKGSLKGSYYRHCFPDAPAIKTYDVCLVSQYHSKEQIVLIRLLKRYLETHRLRVCVALRTNSEAERLYYEMYFGDSITVIPQYPYNFLSTYQAMDASKVVVTVNSTAGLEAFGWGKKVLFCNFGDEEISDFYSDSFQVVQSPDGTEFQDKLTALIELDQSEYEQMTAHDRKYMMNYGEQPVHQFIRELVVKEIETK